MAYDIRRGRRLDPQE